VNQHQHFHSLLCALLVFAWCTGCGSNSDDDENAAVHDGGGRHDSGPQAARDGGSEPQRDAGAGNDAATGGAARDADVSVDADVDAMASDGGADAGEHDAGSPCGDGTIAAPEECDDGNRDAVDGCSAACTVEDGFSCTGATRSACVSLGGAPRGTISFFSAVACPQYWESATAVEGRLVVGATVDVGLTVGTALTAMEDRTHHHSVTAHVAPSSLGIAAADGANESGAAATAFDATFMTGDAPSGLPMMHLRACRSTLGSPSGDAYPAGAVVAFDTPACPTGWSSFADATGRTLVGTSGATATVGTALSSGEMRIHSHDWSGDVATASASFTGTSGANLLAADSALAVTGTTDPAWDGIPYVQLRYCQKEDAPDGSALPEDALAFFPGGACPASWSDALVDGQYIVGAPEGGVVGGTFGASGHTHAIDAQLTFAAHGIALASGCCASGYRSAGETALAGSAAAASETFPRLELRACVK
jgi:cysteine-rich repeat protein